MKLVNDKGETVYFNSVEKYRGKVYWVIKGVDGTLVYGRDRQKRRSRSFTQEAQALSYLDRHGFVNA